MPSVRYQFIATGQDSVITATRGIAAEAARAQARVRSSAAGMERAQTQAANRSAAAATKAEAKRYREAEKAAAKIEKEFAKETKAAEKSAEAKIKAEEKAARARQRLSEQTASRNAAAYAKESKARERAAQREAAERRRIAQQAGANGMGLRASEVAVGAATTVGTIAVGALGAGERKSLELHEMANRLSINARAAGGQFIDPTTLRKEFENTSIATPGVESKDVAEAMMEYVGKTGDLAAGRRFQSTFAKAASGSGAKIQDVASAAAALQSKFGIQSEAEMQSALSSIIFQGKAGSFEMKDAASQYDKLTAAGSRFGLDKGLSGVKTLGGLTQIARSATGSSEQATTAVEATLRQLVSKSDEIHKMGVDVFKDKDKTQTRDVQDVLVETIAGAKGNLTKLQEIFGEEGIRGISPLISAFNEAGKAAGKNATEQQRMAAGQAAMREVLGRSINATGDWSEVLKDSAQASTDATKQTSAAWEKFASDVGDSLNPTVQRLAEHLDILLAVITPLSDKIATVVDAFDAVAAFLKSKFPSMFPDEKGVKGGSAREKLANVNQELSKLKDRSTVLMPAERARKRELERAQVTLESEVAGSKSLPVVEEVVKRGQRRVEGPAAKYEGLDAIDRILGNTDARKLPTEDKTLVAPGVDTANTVGKAIGDATGLNINVLKPMTDAMQKQFDQLSAAAKEAAESLKGIEPPKKAGGSITDGQ